VISIEPSSGFGISSTQVLPRASSTIAPSAVVKTIGAVWLAFDQVASMYLPPVMSCYLFASARAEEQLKSCFI